MCCIDIRAQAHVQHQAHADSCNAADRACPRRSSHGTSRTKQTARRPTRLRAPRCRPGRRSGRGGARARRRPARPPVQPVPRAELQTLQTLLGTPRRRDPAVRPRRSRRRRRSPLLPLRLQRPAAAAAARRRVHREQQRRRLPRHLQGRGWGWGRAAARACCGCETWSPRWSMTPCTPRACCCTSCTRPWADGVVVACKRARPHACKSVLLYHLYKDMLPSAACAR